MRIILHFQKILQSNFSFLILSFGIRTTSEKKEFADYSIQAKTFTDWRWFSMPLFSFASITVICLICYNKSLWAKMQLIEFSSVVQARTNITQIQVSLHWGGGKINLPFSL